MVAPGRGMAPPIVARSEGFADVSSMDAVIRDLESRYDRPGANPGINEPLLAGFTDDDDDDDDELFVL